MPEPSFLLVLEAVSFACRAHGGQLRKDGQTPYAAHPLRVMLTVREEFGVTDPVVLAAAALHDTIEDTTVDCDDLIRRFGVRVADLVAALSKDKRLPEREREREYLLQLARAPIDAKLIKLADTIDNLRDAPTSHQRSSTPRGVRKAGEVLAAFEEGFPAQWSFALDTVRAAVDAASERDRR